MATRSTTQLSGALCSHEQPRAAFEGDGRDTREGASKLEAECFKPMPLRHFSLLVPGKNAARVPDTLSSRRMTHRVSVVHTRLTTATKGRKLDRLRRLRRRPLPERRNRRDAGLFGTERGGRRVVHLTLICSSLLFVRCRFLPLTRADKVPVAKRQSAPSAKVWAARTSSAERVQTQRF